MPAFANGIIGQLLYFVFFMIFMLFYSRIMVTQIMFKLERSAVYLEGLSTKAEKLVTKKIKKKPDAKLRKNVKNFLEFFAIGPVNLDPYGIMNRLEHLIDLQKERFRYFVKQVTTPDIGSEERANIEMGLSGAMSLHQLAKIVRHFVELIKKTKSYNLAIIIQMQLPLIERMAKALMSGTESLSNGWPIGDSIGPYFTANLIGESKYKEVDEDTIVCKKKYNKRDVIIIKAKGPGGRTGNPGRVLEKISTRTKIAKIISIDAAAKFEGEKTGSVAEGVGVAMGGIGVERSKIEEVAVSKKIPLDSIIIKMGQEEAIMPMKKSVLNSLPDVTEALDASIERTKEKGTIIIVGVGNTSGVGNDKKDAEKAEKTIKNVLKKIKRQKEIERKRRKRFKLPF